MWQRQNSSEVILSALSNSLREENGGPNCRGSRTGAIVPGSVGAMPKSDIFMGSAFIDQLFDDCDEGHKGYLSRVDFKVAHIRLFGSKPTKTEVDSTFRQYDTVKALIENDEEVSENDSIPSILGLSRTGFHMLIRYRRQFYHAEDEWREAFRAMDVSRTGYLTAVCFFFF